MQRNCRFGRRARRVQIELDEEFAARTSTAPRGPPAAAREARAIRFRSSPPDRGLGRSARAARARDAESLRTPPCRRRSGEAAHCAHGDAAAPGRPRGAQRRPCASADAGRGLGCGTAGRLGGNLVLISMRMIRYIICIDGSADRSAGRGAGRRDEGDDRSASTRRALTSRDARRPFERDRAAIHQIFAANGRRGMRVRVWRRFGFGLRRDASVMVAGIVSDPCSFTTGLAFDLSGGRATY